MTRKVDQDVDVLKELWTKPPLTLSRIKDELRVIELRYIGEQQIITYVVDQLMELQRKQETNRRAITDLRQQIVKKLLEEVNE